jgi:hypothetical protein
VSIIPLFNSFCSEKFLRACNSFEMSAKSFIGGLINILLSVVDVKFLPPKSLTLTF